jgi:hypothetical protein
MWIGAVGVGRGWAEALELGRIRAETVPGGSRAVAAAVTRRDRDADPAQEG